MLPARLESDLTRCAFVHTQHGAHRHHGLLLLPRYAAHRAAAFTRGPGVVQPGAVEPFVCGAQGALRDAQKDDTARFDHGRQALPQKSSHEDYELYGAIKAQPRVFLVLFI